MNSLSGIIPLHTLTSILSEEDALGVYFTSGTTGVPKPILYTHKSLYTAAVSNALTIPLGLDHNSVIYCPLYHTATFFFWLPCLFKGGKGTLLLKLQPAPFIEDDGAGEGDGSLYPYAPLYRFDQRSGKRRDQCQGVRFKLMATHQHRRSAPFTQSVARSGEVVPRCGHPARFWN